MKKYKNDIILIAAVLVCAGLILIGINIFKKAGNSVRIEINGSSYLEFELNSASMPLLGNEIAAMSENESAVEITQTSEINSSDETVPVLGSESGSEMASSSAFTIEEIESDDESCYMFKIVQENGAYNTVCIKDGKVSVTDASCPDKLCVHEGEISSAGENIICLPNKMIITIIGEKSEDAPDIIVQ